MILVVTAVSLTLGSTRSARSPRSAVRELSGGFQKRRVDPAGRTILVDLRQRQEVVPVQQSLHDADISLEVLAALSDRACR